MRKFLLVVSLGLGTFLIWNILNFSEPIKPQYISNLDFTPNENKNSREILEAINSNSRSIHSLQCTNVSIICKMDRAVSLRGQIYYEKPSNFRMMVHSWLGDELDIGCNSEILWFWSKRMDPSALYWSPQKDYTKTRLKPIFNPRWTSGIFSLNEISLENTVLDCHQNPWKILSASISGSGETMSAITLVDPLNKTILGQCIGKDHIIGGSEIAEFQKIDGHIIPKIIHLFWYDEKVSMSITLNNPKINLGILQQHWKMPNYQPQINMSTDSQ